MGQLFKGALIGGVIIFVWSFISHMFIGWHEIGYERFTDEQVVADVLSAHTTGSGMYMYPMGPDPGPNATSEECAAAEEEAWALMEKGPFAFVVFTEGAWSGMTRPLIGSFLINLLTAFLITALLLAAPGLTFWGKVAFIVVAGVAGSAAVFLQYWNWWGFTTSVVAIGIIDTAVGWFLAGMAMAKWVRMEKG